MGSKPLLQQIYSSFYERIIALIDPQIPGRIVEIGSGIGNLKAHLPGAISTDLFANPWLDLACDGYDLPFKDGSLSHLVLFDVFHHLRAPNAFLREARRVLTPPAGLFCSSRISVGAVSPCTDCCTTNRGVEATHQPRRCSAAFRAITTPLRATPRASFFAAKFRAGRRVGWSFMRMPSAVSAISFPAGTAARALSDALPARHPALRPTPFALAALFGARCLVGLQRV